MPLQELALGLQMCSWETWFPKLPAERVSGKNIQQNLLQLAYKTQQSNKKI